MSNKVAVSGPEDMSQFDWIQLKKDIGSKDETFMGKLARKTNENPFVPLGCLATTMALGFGLYNFRQGKRQMSQNMMRLRIVAQGLTVVALVVGVTFRPKS